MKKFLAIIILSSYFLTSSQADSIKDFEIEGVSIGDSLLSYVNKSEINNNLAKYYKDNEYSSFLIFKDKGTFELKDYDHMVLSFKTNDSNFKIEAISGVIFYKEKISQCYKDMKGVIKEISNIINISPTKIKKIKSIHGYNTFSTFDFSKGKIAVSCTDYDSKYTNYVDHMRITNDTNEFENWLHLKAYK